MKPIIFHRLFFSKFFAIIATFFIFSMLGAQSWENQIWLPKNYKSERISSYDRSGGNDDFIVIPKNSKVTIANISGAGVIKHIWFTLASKDPMIRRNAILRIYWDKNLHPSVEVPLGDFFGQGWGEEYILNSLPLVAAPKKGKALNSFIPMPFSSEARIEIENQSDLEIPSFYFYIDYESMKSEPASKLRFHAWWNKSVTEPATDSGKENEWSLLGETEKAPLHTKNNYTILKTKGKGHFIGLNLYVDSPTPMWYGEGDDAIQIDGEVWPPRLHGTGTEDLFNTAWCPKEVFMHPYFGYPRISDGTGWLGRTHLYRFWIESPLAFERNFQFTIEHGHANSLTLDLVSVAYWYQEIINEPMPVLPKKELRQNQPEINFRHIHKWRDSFRSEKGKGLIWGHE
ncbi:hypothetical protein LPTSP3_g35250 [Leptospira kobayashii]|uniref:DUF2961 domain-containing protein n=1 Tax=Leptospira kobayashii TaxID=1917830 RepID=A0ABM7UNK5_9LEPT|nr:glycoside hydrolase family 172 protein [Leptospira kobayashii]BDA80595.1 hypothetical protein LPTSP3_g35250 [Leptospira kobayashii]